MTVFPKADFSNHQMNSVLVFGTVNRSPPETKQTES